MLSIWFQAFVRIDIVSMKLFLRLLRDLFPWAVQANGGVLDSDLFFCERYSDLAEYHRSNGRIAKADRLASIAECYFRAAPDDDEPPEAAAIAMPVPRPRLKTNAVSTTRVPKAPAAPRPERVPSPPS